ncbi:hypothetical protein BDN72DRAFT_865681 [Pluteus cervinus]|uniref:Uncharacterized protein n=1 Tax=Pluteus cervinus TaxID=181527 RepID=A0ACD2ZZG5_9AGAR|nr:hypothetical protein BDN72DRAFT_865681 [Pluteus cervinus]
MLTYILPDSVYFYFVAAEQYTGPALSQENPHSPIHSLPPELLQEIFAFSASPFPDPAPLFAYARRNQRFNTTSLRISCVCSYWRSLSFVTSEMWSWMIVSSPDKRCLELVKYYLGRAGDVQGLNLFLKESDSPPVGRQWAPAILRLWIPEARRWSSIHFDFHHTPPIPEMINLPPETLSGITSVSLKSGMAWRRSIAEQFWDVLHTSPALKAVDWNLTRVPSSAPFSQLSSIEGLNQTLSLTEFLSLLSSCTRLRSIIATVVPVAEAEALSKATTIVAPYLEVLLLPMTPMEIKSGILLDYVQAPSLRELEVYVSRSDSAVLRRFLSTSGCLLRKLKLKTKDSVHSEGNVLDYLLEAAPYLRSVEMCDLFHKQLSSLTMSAFSPQMVNGDISILLPSVVSLRLLLIGSVPEGAIGDMLSSRAKYGAIPWCFEFYFTEDNYLQTRDYRVILQLQKQGLYVKYG